MSKYLKDLCELNGASGNEKAVREHIKKIIESKVDTIIEDPIGNLIAIKKCGKTDAKKLLLMAHTDEVGLMVTSIESDGRLAVQPVGGVDPRVLLGKRVVVGEKSLNGVIGYKAIHLQKEDFSTPPKWSSIRVEIGCNTKEEAEKQVELGDYVHFYSPFEEYENRYVGKAFDDRAGCAVLMEIIEKVTPQNFDLYFAFVVQEEIGLRGSGAVLKHVRPNALLVFEGTTAGDNPELKEERWSTHLDNGPALSYLQSGYVINELLFNSVRKTAETNQIPYQMKGRTVGGTDATRAARTYFGVPGAVINVPSRYIHSPVSVISKSDFSYVVELATKVVCSDDYINAVEGWK